jgi:hypothetical protein
MIFTTTSGLVEFMHKRLAGEWQVRLVSDHDSLVLLLADLLDQGAPGICLDPTPNGSAGTFFTLVAFRRAIAAS